MNIATTEVASGVSCFGLRADERVVFMHIPKTAGSSLHAMLSEVFERRLICPERFDRIKYLQFDEVERYRFFSGHFSRSSVERIPGPKRVFTVLREPKSRILSLYYFWRSHRKEIIDRDDLAGPRLAKELDLLSFLTSDHPAIRAGTDNAMTRQLLGAGFGEELSGFRLEDAEFSVETAMQFLRRLFFVGFQERFSSDVPRLMVALGLPLPTKIVKANSREINESNPNHESVERQVRTLAVERALERLTTLDTMLYKRALAERESTINPYPM